MIDIGLIIATILLLGCFVCLLLYGRRLRQATTAETEPYPGLIRLDRWTLLLPYIGVGAGLVTLMLIEVIGQANGTVGSQPTIVPAAIGTMVLLGLLVGELICYRSARQPGVAGLERRRATRYIEWPLVALLGLTILAVAGFIGWRWNAPGGTQTIQFDINSDYSGSAYAFIITDNSMHVMAALLLAATVLAVIIVAVVTRRPRNGSDPTLATIDDALRRRSLRITMVALFGAIIVSLGAGLASQVPTQTSDDVSSTVVVLPPSGCATPLQTDESTMVLCIDPGTDDGYPNYGPSTYTISFSGPLTQTPGQSSELLHLLVILTMTALMLALIAAAALPPKTPPLKPEDSDEPSDDETESSDEVEQK